MQEEEWRVLSDFPGYEISSHGRVKSLPKQWTQTYKNKGTVRNGRNSESIMVGGLNRGGYPSVGLRRCGKSHTKAVHRLVAETFLENPRGLECVNHKDGNRLNNNVNNLEWCTQKYNMQHSTLLPSFAEKLAKLKRKLSWDTVNWCRAVVTIGEPEFSIKSLAERCGVAAPVMWQIIHERIWKYPWSDRTISAESLLPHMR